MTEPTAPTATDQSTTDEKIIDYAGNELTKPAPHLILPATAIAILACGLFLFINGCDGGQSAPPAEEPTAVDVDLGDDGVDVDVNDDKVDVEVGDNGVKVDIND